MSTHTKQKSKAAPSYEDFLHGLQLIDLSLKSCSAFVDSGGLFGMLSKDKSPVRAFRNEYKLTKIGQKYFEAEGQFTVTESANPDSAPPLKMEFVFEVHMHATASVWKEGAERFVESELRLLLIPHARQFVLNMCGQMGIPPVVLPLAVGGS